MKTWKMPDPPPYEVYRIKDRDGREYERVETDGSLWRDAMWTRWDWDNLVYQRGPIEADE